MFRALAILASVVSVSAFAPSGRVASSSLKMSNPFENALGAQPPLGFYDPLGFLNGADQAKFDV